MTEDTGWPYGLMPSEKDVTIGTSRIVVQATEDGFYAFCFIGNKQVASMVGPAQSMSRCYGLAKELLGNLK